MFLNEPRDFCYRCFKPTSVCVCATVAEVANRTHVHILQQPREQHRAIGTVRFASLGLLRCTVEVNAPATGEPSVLAAAPPANAALLFPSPHARAVETLPAADRPTTLIVLDGTWHQVKALVRNNPWLQALPHVCLNGSGPSRYRIRREPQVNYLSTVEAILTTLGHLEPETEGFAELLQAFDSMIDTQVVHSQVGALRLRPPKTEHGSPRLPELLAQSPNRHVLLLVETVGAGPAARPIQVCAWRLATGERFECLIRHEPESDARKCARLALSTADFAAAVDEAEFARRWAAFCRDDDVLLSWNQRSLRFVGQPERAVLVKAAWCNFVHHGAGHLSDVVAKLELPLVPAYFRGAAAVQMAELQAVVGWLLDQPS